MRVVLGRQKGGKQQHDNSNTTTTSSSTTIESSSVIAATASVATNSAGSAGTPSSTKEATASIDINTVIDDSISLKPKASPRITASSPTTTSKKERVTSPVNSLIPRLLSSTSTIKTKSSSSTTFINSRKRPLNTETLDTANLSSFSATSNKKLHSAELPAISSTTTIPPTSTTASFALQKTNPSPAIQTASSESTLLDSKLPAVSSTVPTDKSTTSSSNNMRIINHNNHNPHHLYHNNNPSTAAENNNEDPASTSNHQYLNNHNDPALLYIDEGNSMVNVSGQQEAHHGNNDADDEEETSPNESSCTAMASFEKSLKTDRGLEIKEQEGDGNCLFRAISLQIYGDANMHPEIRKRCLDFMEADEPHFGQFVTEESFHDYIVRKRHDGVHGNNPEIQAISELFNRPIEVFVPENGAKPLNIFHAEYKTGDAPIRLSYHDGNHYNAVIDPLVPTAGLGLGLPGLEPGLADRMQVAKAKEESDRLADEEETRKVMAESHNDDIQRAIKESSDMYQNMYKQKAMVLSDMEATEMELEQAILVSSLESYQQTEVGRKKPSHKQKYKHHNNQKQQQHHHQPKQHHRASDQQKQRATTKSLSSSSAATGSASTISRSSNRPASLSAPSPPLQLSSSSSKNETPTIVSASTATASASISSSMASTTTTATPVATAAASTTAAAPAASQDEYPQTVQELVMNGFELSKVVRAYDLIGDNFDDILSYLMTTAT